MNEEIDLHLVPLRGDAAQHRTARREALRRVLGERLGVPPGELRFRQSKWGKPELVGQRLAFNLSHSGDLALIAIAERGAIGVDLEQVRLGRPIDRLARRALTEAERETLSNAGDERARVEWLYRCWTAKEATAKAFGFGLALASQRMEVEPRGNERASVSVAPAAVSVAATTPLPAGAGPIEVSWTRPAEGFLAAVATVP